MLQTPDNEDPTIIFLHILKTAGTTLNVILENYFSRENSFATFPNRQHPDGSLERFRALTTRQKARLDLLTGHMGFGLHEELPRPTVYITLLRNPVDRVVSRYYHEKRDPGSYLHEPIHDGMSLVEYTRYYAEAAEMDNLQTRMIAGNWNQRGHGPCTDAMLDTAKENLQTHFAAVGLTERFDAFYLLLTRLFGWQPVYYRRRNVTRNRRRVDNLPPETIRVLRQYNEYDFALYDYAARLFEEQLAAQGSDFTRQVRQFQLRNRLDAVYKEIRRHSVRVYLRERLGKKT